MTYDPREYRKGGDIRPSTIAPSSGNPDAQGDYRNLLALTAEYVTKRNDQQSHQDPVDQMIESQRVKLKGQQLALFDCLCSGRRGREVTYQDLRRIDCWKDDDPEDSAIKTALKKLQGALDGRIGLTISDKYHKANLTFPKV